eukprot:CAMPEP_0175800250 /NCGR_PEP_ID=MMETSP0097-20121207/86916_1 /TAXON_ID=311494 /ORGANISM="Alexandrium monilatum, Strain CCMP3105" /LENGTH=253 /DNA_ID=CAMNT_0017111525 /DNA_START=102 /DNA_END=859 /DNA_ORIENTATION=-
MIRFALRALEFCFHCLDASPWPFLLAEVLDNYALSVESPGEFLWQRTSVLFSGVSTHLGGAEADGVPSLDPAVAGAAALAGLPPLRRALLRLRVRWVRGLEMEAEFWRKKLSTDPSENSSLERLRLWLETGEVTWFLEGDDLCAFLEQALHRRRAAAEALAALDAARLDGEGPPARLREVPVVAADGMARFYLRVLDEHGLLPRHLPVQCPVEELHGCFPSRHFDVVHMRNALDHAFDPLLGLRGMLHVLRPG